MAIVWHGHYAVLFEEASTELRRECGLTYEAFFETGLRAPVVKLHVDYHLPLFLDQWFTTTASMIWTDAARLDVVYEVRREDSRIAATGYTVQLFVQDRTGEPCFTVPELLRQCRERWRVRERAR